MIRRRTKYFGHIFIIIDIISYASSSSLGRIDARRSLAVDNSRFIYYLSCKIFYSWEPSKVQRASKSYHQRLITFRSISLQFLDDNSSNFFLSSIFQNFLYHLLSTFIICSVCLVDLVSVIWGVGLGSRDLLRYPHFDTYKNWRPK